jgi:hypothetical protein
MIKSVENNARIFLLSVKNTDTDQNKTRSSVNIFEDIKKINHNERPLNNPETNTITSEQSCLFWHSHVSPSHLHIKKNNFTLKKNIN